MLLAIYVGAMLKHHRMVGVAPLVFLSLDDFDYLSLGTSTEPNQPGSAALSAARTISATLSIGGDVNGQSAAVMPPGQFDSATPEFDTKKASYLSVLLQMCSET